MKRWFITSVKWAVVLGLVFSAPARADWYKGVTHVHSLWSDGDAAPEMIAAWYKDRGYHFVCFSEHFILQEGERYVRVSADGPPTAADLTAIEEKFGPDWLQVQDPQDLLPRMRLKTHEELSAYFNEAGKFLLVPAEEITSRTTVVHVNGVNLREQIAEADGAIPEVLQHYLDTVAQQSKSYRVPMIAHVNHLNWRSGVTSEQMIGLRGLRFFEIYNGHPGVHTWGRVSAGMPSMDEHWDIIQSMRLRKGASRTLLYGVATDDSHEYHEWGSDKVNPGRGWIMVQADELEADALMRAMLEGDFYASTGVTLRAVTGKTDALTVDIDVEPGVRYTTQFIGTRRGFDAASGPRLDGKGAPLPGATRKYSPDIGEVLYETADNPATYAFTGEELYVRAKVTSDKPQTNPAKSGDVEMAWVQPIRAR